MGSDENQQLYRNLEFQSKISVIIPNELTETIFHCIKQILVTYKTTLVFLRNYVIALNIKSSFFVCGLPNYG